MAANKITYVDKETLTALPLIAEKNKITGDNATEIKTVVNSHADNIDTLTANNHQQNTDTGTNQNAFSLGDGLIGNKVLEANNSAVQKPKIRFNETSQVWERTNDGTTYADLGGGGGNPLDSSSGVISFGGFTIASATTFDIGEIKAQFIDFTDPENPIIAPVVTRAAQAGITDPLIATANITYVLMNSAGVLLYQGTEPTATDMTDKAFVGQIGHPDRATITSAISVTSNVQNPISQVRELFTGLGPIVQSGLTFEAAATLMKVSLAAGTVVDLGLGSDGNEPYSATPNTKSYAAVDPVTTFLYVASDGSNASATVVDPDNYDPNGDILNLVAVPNNKFTVQYIVVFKGGFVNIQYGQTVYDSLDNALNAVIRGESYTFADVINESALVRSALILQKGITGNLADAVTAGTAHFHNFGKFGAESGSSGHSGVAGTTFQVVYENSVIPQIITDATRGAVFLQRGTALDTDTVIGVKNGAGTTAATISGEGKITGKVLSVSGEILSSVSDAAEVRHALIQAGNGDLAVEIAANGTGDPFVMFEGSSARYGFGIDESDGQALQLRAASAPSAASPSNGASLVKIELGGLFTFNSNVGGIASTAALTDGAAIAFNMASNTLGIKTLSTVQAAITLTLSNVTQGANQVLSVEKNIAGDVTITLAGTGLSFYGYNDADLSTTPSIVLTGAIGDIFDVSFLARTATKIGVAVGQNGN